MDVTGEIRHELGIELVQCSVLGVVCPLMLLQAVVTGAASLTMIPLHLVITERGQFTGVYLLNPNSVESNPPAGMGPTVQHLMARVSKCLDRLGMRQTPSCAVLV
jgi:hypothetical protein